jgi:predicted DNA-binding protein
MADRKNYSAQCMFILTPEQKRFLQLYSDKTGRTYSAVLRNYINALMEKHKGLAKQAEEAVKEGW